MSAYGYSDAIEPCGQKFGYGDTCPLSEERRWVTQCYTYSTSEGSATTPAANRDYKRLERKYDAIYGCLSKCTGKVAQRKAIKRMVHTEG